MDSDAVFWFGAGAAALALTIVAIAELIIVVREWREARRRYKARQWSDWTAD